MTDVYIVTLLILGFLITSPGLAAAINLLMPGVAGRAYLRAAQTPVKSFFMGAGVSLVMIVWVLILVNIHFGLIQLGGWISALVGLGILAIGTASVARLLGERIGGTPSDKPNLGNIVRGAVIYELACLTPFVGWFLFTPVMGLVSVGAAVFGLIGWAPKPRQIVVPAILPADPGMPVSGVSGVEQAAR